MTRSPWPHPVQVAGHLDLVRRIVERVATAGVIPPEVLAALNVVTAWLHEGTANLAALEAAREAAHCASAARFRAVSWTGTAAGNLCWMACGERGWEDGPRTILDACVYALSSLPDGGDGLVIRAALRAELDAALESAAREIDVSRPRARPPDPLPLPDWREPLGAAALRCLEDQHAVIDPRRRAADEAQLVALLAAHRYQVHPAVLAFDARFGGLVTDSLRVGAFALLSTGRLRERGGKGQKDLGLVPVMLSGDLIFFLDGNGAAWAQEMIADPDAQPFATRATTMLARHLLQEETTTQLPGHRGDELAQTFALTPIEQACDALGRAWEGPDGLVIETHGPDAGDMTLVSASLADTLR
ncbi:MAG: hypothetical protein H0T76_09450 [Nannocystis sp.]|nr:hypothetical protein [Nannocystis sp.]MBA3546694.1 hypothetical protein [Nannocystis sp.]